MSWSKSDPSDSLRSFDEYIQEHLADLERDPRVFLEPLARELGPLHDAQSMHGGLHPAALRYSADGFLDVAFFLAQRRVTGGKPDPRIAHAYLAPEVFLNHGGDSASDLYALGAILFQIVTGSPPAAAVRRTKKKDRLKASHYPQWSKAALEAINDCLALDPKARLRTIHELWAAFTAPESPQTGNAKQPAFPAKLELKDRLPNASVGKAYGQNLLEIFGEHAARIVDLKITLSKPCGLEFDEPAKSLRGTPFAAGELTIALEFRLDDTENAALAHTVALTINPDPGSLWKNLPSDPAGLFAKPDEAAAFLESPSLVALGASLRGRSHAHAGRYRDDDFAMKFLPAGEWHLFVVADGAGSAQYSRRGSEIACGTAISALEAMLAPKSGLDELLSGAGKSLEALRRAAHNVLAQAAYRAFAAISKEAGETGTIRDFATTLIAVLAKKIQERWFLASFSIGDGGAAAVLEQGVEVLTLPDSGEFAGQTNFLTSPGIFTDSVALLARTKAVFCENLHYFALMTDGITDPLFPSEAAFSDPETWRQWRAKFSEAVPFDAPKSGLEHALLGALHFPSPGNHDDRTLLLALPKTV